MNVLLEKSRKAKYVGLQEYPKEMNKPPFFLVNDSTGSTVKYNPVIHDVSVKDLHLMKKDLTAYKKRRGLDVK